MTIACERVRGANAEFLVVLGKCISTTTLSRDALDESWNERAFLVNEPQSSNTGAFTEIKRRKSLPRRPPLNMNKATASVASKPIAEVREVWILRIEHGGKADDAPRRRVGPSQQPLDQYFIADFAATKPDHVPLVENDQSDIVQHVRILAQCKIELLGRGNDDRRSRESVDIARRRSAAPYRDVTEASSGTNVRPRTRSTCADRARSGVTYTARRPSASVRKRQSSAMRVFPALVGSAITRSSVGSVERVAAVN